MDPDKKIPRVIHWRTAQPRLMFLVRAGSAVASQGFLSIAHFLAGWLLLRSAGPAVYAYWVLGMGAITLLVSLQVAFLGPTLSLRLPVLDHAGRRDLVGALLGEQQRLLRWCGGLGLLGILVTMVLLPAAGTVTALTTLVAALAAAYMQLRREFLRQILYARNQPLPILGGDFTYLLVLVAGILGAQRLPSPWGLPAAILALVVSSALAHCLLARAVDRELAPIVHRRPGLPHEMAPLALWSTSGAALAWITSQGVLYLVAAQLGHVAVAALAAARLPLMPMNLLVSGLGGLLVPSAARWRVTQGLTALRRRLWAISAVLGVVTALWTLALFVQRDRVLHWLSPEVLPHAPVLLVGWGLAYTLLAVRDTLAYVPAATGRYRTLTLLTAGIALVTVAACLLSMRWIPDARGALLGVVAGEVLALVGVIWVVSRTPTGARGLTPAGTASPA